MSRIEEAAKPFVGSMVQGRGTILDKDAQATVATWIVKTCLVQLFARPGELDHRLASAGLEFGQYHAPTQPYNVSVAAFTGDKWATLSHFQPVVGVPQNESRTAADRLEGFIATIVVGHLVGQAIHFPVRMWPQTKEGSWKLIFPYETDFVWPPGRFLNPEAVERAARTPFPAIDPHPRDGTYKWSDL